MSARRSEKVKKQNEFPPQADALEQKIDLLTRLVAIAILEKRTQRDQIRCLSIAGMTPTKIADLLGTTPNTVNVALNSLRRAKELSLRVKGANDGKK